MKVYLIIVLLAFALLTLGASISKPTTTSACTSSSSTTHCQRIRGSSSAIATPLPLPDWELKNRDRWIPTYNGRPCPNEDGCPLPTKKVTKRAAAVAASATNVVCAAFARTFRTMNVACGASGGSDLTTPHGSVTTFLSPITTPPPKVHHNDLAHRQVAIPYIPADWTTTTQCPAVFGSPCTTVSQYLALINEGARRASKEAARASSVIENGLYVPGMNVPNGAGGLEVRIGGVFMVVSVAINMVL